MAHFISDFEPHPKRMAPDPVAPEAAVLADAMEGDTPQEEANGAEPPVADASGGLGLLGAPPAEPVAPVEPVAEPVAPPLADI